MLKQITFRIPGETDGTVMHVAAPNSTTRYLAKDIDGLGPVKADISTSSLALLDGVSLDYTRTGMRNIVIKFEYMPNWGAGETVYHLRQDFYKIAGPKRVVELVFHLDGVGTRSITGVVESIESEMFTQDLNAQISIVCTNPYFVGESKQHTLTPATNNDIWYDGDVPAGVIMGGTLAVVGQNMRFRRYNSSIGWQELRIEETIAAGEGLMINTVDREKYAKLWAGKNLIPYLTVRDWWKLFPGRNSVSLIGTTTSGSYPEQGTYSLEYKVLYGGL